MATSATPLSVQDASAKLKVELIENGIGTQAVHETVVAYRANRRAGTHKVKTKGEVSGSNKKPWRQKGTGRARAGYRQSPLWRGGGVVHGPVPRDYSKKTPKKVKKLALRKAISARVAAGDVYVVAAPKLDQPKTKTLFSQLAFNEDCRALLVLEGVDRNVVLSSRNSQLLDTVTAADLNAEHLLKYDRILATDAALGILAERLN
ncbi:MAG: 50S ribosomal protein L4 [Verrucomicrobiota bacterium]